MSANARSDRPGRSDTTLFQRGDLIDIADYYVSAPQDVADIEWDHVENGAVFVVTKHHRYDGYAPLRQWMARVRSLGDRRVILVTPQVDEPIPLDLAESILACENVVHWYTDNWSRAWAHPRLTIIPIGVSGHMARRADLPDMTGSDRRPLRCLANFQHFIAVMPRSGSRSDRLDCIRELHDKSFVTWSKSVPVDAYVRSFEGYSFVLSPLGTRLDCRRTWEALACGCIPIVKRSTLIPLWRQYPIVVVGDWAEVTRVNLERWKAELAPQFSADIRYRLSLDYWGGVIRSGERPESPIENGKADDEVFLRRSESEIFAPRSLRGFFGRNPVSGLARYIWIHLRFRRSVSLNLKATVRHDLGSGWTIARKYLRHALRVGSGFPTST